MEHTFQKPATDTTSREIAGIRTTLVTIKPDTLKSTITNLKTGSPANIRYVDCQCDKDNCGKAFQGALYLNVWFAEIAGKLFEKFIKQVPTTFDTLAKADMVVFYCVLGVARSPTTVVEYQKAVASSLGRNKDQLVVLLDGGMTAYNNQPQPVLSMWLRDWTLPSNGKVLAWGTHGQFGPKPVSEKSAQIGKPISQPPSKPSLQQVPQSDAQEYQVPLVYPET
ncbi:MAG: hypothetical protein HETSPECPRED_001543 [Heterodermia speciosa]|uniref:Rhodanese domain-containing protein n=1 Tax=Heterodermia speciosa TaxID=116794 RepID=A0A8H3PE44_9LECA|nr:MAG: hypothetical protein HETSPECPRED_001543 [Heterodermia speciosa]